MTSALLVFLSVWLALGVNAYPRLVITKQESRDLDQIDWMRGFIDSLRSGATATEALKYAKADLIPTAKLRISQPTELAAALAVDAKTQNSLLLKALAACWQVSQLHGSPLAPAMQSALDAQLDRIAVADEIKSQLAGPRAAALTLALLPVATLLLAQSLGIAAIGWLFGTAIGIAVLVVGVLFLSIGTAVMFSLAKNIERELQL